MTMNDTTTDTAAVRSQYATEDNLQTRMSVWHPTADGREPTCEALDAVLAAAPTSVLEVGCGTGAFAARVAAALPDAQLVAVDQSPRLVELTRSRGVKAHVGDLQDLHFADDSFDVVAALWMLYHVRDLHLGLSEARRVLRPGGRLHFADAQNNAGLIVSGEIGTRRAGRAARAHGFGRG